MRTESGGTVTRMGSITGVDSLTSWLNGAVLWSGRDPATWVGSMVHEPRIPAGLLEGVVTTPDPQAPQECLMHHASCSQLGTSWSADVRLVEAVVAPVDVTAVVRAGTLATLQDAGDAPTDVSVTCAVLMELMVQSLHSQRRGAPPALSLTDAVAVARAATQDERGVVEP